MSLLKDLPLHQQLLKALDKLGFTQATQVQAAAIPAAISGKDLLVSAQTGSGKTAAFLLPVLQRLLEKDSPNTGTRALILLPTRELALQTKKQFQQLAAFNHLNCGLIIGGEAYKHQVATLRKNPEVLIATPGRLVDHIEKGNPDFSDLEILVLDEADRMLDMGFAIAMHTITAYSNPQRQSLLFSATLDTKGMDKLIATFSNPQTIAIDCHRQQHSHISQQVILADDIKHKEKLVDAIIREEATKKVIIFCNKRVQCEKLCHFLTYKKWKANFLHGDIAQNDRKQILNGFRQGSVDILVATDLAARGLDIQDVDLVINFAIAHSGDDHVHRVGRTGRAGRAGKAICLVSADEWSQMSSIERYLHIRFQRRVIKDLKASYKGPKKLKKSGKIAGSKKKKNDSKISKSVKKPKTTNKLKRVTGDGFDAIRKKEPQQP